MYLGQFVEISPSKELFKMPLHPYTKALLSAIPSVDIHHKKERIILKGEIVSPINPKPGLIVLLVDVCMLLRYVASLRIWRRFCLAIL